MSDTGTCVHLFNQCVWVYHYLWLYRFFIEGVPPGQYVITGSHSLWNISKVSKMSTQIN